MLWAARPSKMEEMDPRDVVMEAEEALLDAIEVYAAGTENKLLLEEYMNFPAPLVQKSRRLREIIYACEGLGKDYLQGIEMASMQTAAVAPESGILVLTEKELQDPLPVRDEYLVAQEDLLGAIDDYSHLLWQGRYSDITRLGRNLREAVALHEGLGEDYLAEGGPMMSSVGD